MEHVHSIVQEVPYNFSRYLMKEFTSNLWSSRPFLVYPHFLMSVSTHQLGFGGVPIWYPRAEMLLQERFYNTLLVPTGNNTRLVTPSGLLLS
ncbi:hypothetical protein Hanom_Chr15g01373711 [Helianthus anomalus]